MVVDDDDNSAADDDDNNDDDDEIVLSSYDFIVHLLRIKLRNAKHNRFGQCSTLVRVIHSFIPIRTAYLSIALPSSAGCLLASSRVGRV